MLALYAMSAVLLQIFLPFTLILRTISRQKKLSQHRTVTFAYKLKWQSITGVFLALFYLIYSFLYPALTWSPDFIFIGKIPGIVFHLDILSASFGFLTALISALIARFSTEYIWGERWFKKFFFHFGVMKFGLYLIIFSSSFPLMLAGWELLGMSSVFLIAFYQERRWPAQNALKTFLTYKICDIGLILAGLFFFEAKGTFVFRDSDLLIPGGTGTVLALLVVFASLGKSALYPMGNWLPRAMEGPTPSSALFYGGLSVHAGIYLLLRFSPLLESQVTASFVLLAVGVITVLHASLAERVQVDAKNSLAYATMTQLGVIAIEISLGFHTFAALHAIAHALLRTYQFLRTPSILHLFHEMQEMHGATMRTHGEQYDKMIPSKAKGFLYKMALEEGYLDNILSFFLSFVFFPISFIYQLKSIPLFKRKAPQDVLSAFLYLLLAAGLVFIPLSFYSSDKHWLSILILALGFAFSLLAFKMRKIPSYLFTFGLSFLLFSFLPIIELPQNQFENLMLLFFNTLAFLGIIYLFFLLERRLGGLCINQFLGLGKEAPQICLFFLIFSMALGFIPGTGNFLLSEQVEEHLFKTSGFISMAYLCGMTLNAISLLRIAFHLFYGKETSLGKIDIGKKEKSIVTTLVVLIFLGLFIPFLYQM